jgi:hypothetical protein
MVRFGKASFLRENSNNLTLLPRPRYSGAFGVRVKKEKK